MPVELAICIVGAVLFLVGIFIDIPSGRSEAPPATVTLKINVPAKLSHIKTKQIDGEQWVAYSFGDLDNAIREIDELYKKDGSKRLTSCRSEDNIDHWNWFPLGEWLQHRATAAQISYFIDHKLPQNEDLNPFISETKKKILATE